MTSDDPLSSTLITAAGCTAGTGGEMRLTAAEVNRTFELATDPQFNALRLHVTTDTYQHMQGVATPVITPHGTIDWEGRNAELERPAQ